MEKCADCQFHSLKLLFTIQGMGQQMTNILIVCGTILCSECCQACEKSGKWFKSQLLLSKRGTIGKQGNAMSLQKKASDL